MSPVSAKTAVFALAVAGCLGAALTGAAASAAPGPAAAGHGKGHPSCVTVDNIWERPHDFFAVGARTPNNPLAKVGDSISYHENMFDSTDKVIGEAVGYGIATHVNPANGNLAVDYYHTGQLADGTFTVFASTEREGLLAGKPYRIWVKGTTGKYAGKSGFGEWKLLDPPSATTRLGIKMTMCG
jgi:hypothetical protein